MLQKDVDKRLTFQELYMNPFFAKEDISLIYIREISKTPSEVESLIQKLYFFLKYINENTFKRFKEDFHQTVNPQIKDESFFLMYKLAIYHIRELLQMLKTS